MSKTLATPMGAVLARRIATPTQVSAATGQAAIARARRIVHIPRRFLAEEWGGTETVILEISHEQKAAGWQPEIFTSQALKAQPAETIAGIPVRRFAYNYPFFGLSAADKLAMDKKGGNLLSLPLFAALLRTQNVRLFHSHALKRLGGEVRTAARLRRKPFVVSLHGGVFDVPAGEMDSMLKPIANKMEWGKPFGALFGSRRILEDADQVICVGFNELEQARKQLPHDRIVYLPNGVCTERFSRGEGHGFRQKYGIPAGAFLVLNISRIDSQKNQKFLLEAFARLQHRRPESFLVLMGPETQPDYARALRQTISDHGLGTSVLLLPGLRNDDPDLVNAYHACDVFALASIHEPFGIVVLEAWSAGKPVIASRVGGLQRLIKPGETGLCFDPNGPDGLETCAAQLESLAADETLRRRLGEAGRAEARAQYDWKSVARQLEEVYQAAEEHAARRYHSRR